MELGKHVIQRTNATCQTFEIQRYWQFPGGTCFSFVRASTRCNESSGSGWLRLSFSEFLSSGSSFSTENPVLHTRCSCGKGGERETGVSESKTQACRQQKWASLLALREVSIAKHLQKRGTHPSPRGRAVTLGFRRSSAPSTPGPRWCNKETGPAYTSLYRRGVWH